MSRYLINYFKKYYQVVVEWFKFPITNFDFCCLFSHNMKTITYTGMSNILKYRFTFEQKVHILTMRNKTSEKIYYNELGQICELELKCVKLLDTWEDAWVESLQKYVPKYYIGNNPYIRSLIEIMR